MHPDFIREINLQRGNELRAEARRVGLARAARKARRGQARLADASMPRIPDYVDAALQQTVPEQRRPASAGRGAR